MNSKINKILAEKGFDGLIAFLSSELTESELNSFLLEVFKNRSETKKASQILKDYSENRFARPSTIDPIKNTENELQILRILNKAGFEIMEFSPLAPFGTASVHKTVHQNKVVSGLRRMEIVSDITNVMALEISKRILEDASEDTIELAAPHRLVRAQGLDDPNYTAHFKIIGMASSWKDKGKYLKEEESMIKHIKLYVDIFTRVYSLEIDELMLNLTVLTDPNNIDISRFKQGIENCVEGLETNTTFKVGQANTYYQGLRFGIQLKSMHYPIVDGGFVNWVSNFTQNKKRRLLISGIGTELMYKIMKA